MKKFTSFLIAGLMILVASASAQQSRVILNSNNNFEVQIDGRAYNSAGTSTITDLSVGAHTVAVYQVVSNGIFGIGKKRNLLSSEQFNLNNNDVTIDVSQNGQVRISQNGYNGNNNTNRNRNGGYNTNRRDDNDNNSTDRNRNGGYDSRNDDNGNYGKSEGKGKGHKYGHYKNKKGKNNNGNQRRDDDHVDDRRRDNN
jgi:hypothetical protein